MFVTPLKTQIRRNQRKSYTHPTQIRCKSHTPSLEKEVLMWAPTCLLRSNLERFCDRPPHSPCWHLCVHIISSKKVLLPTRTSLTQAGTSLSNTFSKFRVTLFPIRRGTDRKSRRQRRAFVKLWNKVCCNSWHQLSHAP